MPAVQINKGKLVSFGMDGGNQDRVTGTVEELDANGNSQNPPSIYEFAQVNPVPIPVQVGSLINFIRVVTPSLVRIAQDIRKGHIDV